jgi:hypothetical protein
MDTKTTVINRTDELGHLIIASNNAPLPWGSQKRMVDLFVELIEKTNMVCKEKVEKLEKVIRNLQENAAILGGKSDHHIRRCRQSR